MASSPPTVLLFGYSFIRRLRDDLRTEFDPRADEACKLSKDAIVHLQGVGGRTMRKLIQYDLSVFSFLSPHAVILEIGTNDLSDLRPEVVGSEIEELVWLLLDSYAVRVIGVCEVFSRVRAPIFNDATLMLNQYLCGVLEPIPNVFCWQHRGFSEPSRDLYLSDGVHVNSSGQYLLYRSYQGAILQALRMLACPPAP